jgi:hypothetical protein
VRLCCKLVAPASLYWIETGFLCMLDTDRTVVRTVGRCGVCEEEII